MKKPSKLAAIGLGIFLAFSGQAAAQNNNKKRVEFGSNLAEQAYVSDGSFRTRLLNNADLNIGNLQLGYSGLNEIDDTSLRSYFGSHIFKVGRSGDNTAVASKWKTFGDRIEKPTLGIYNDNLFNRIGSGNILVTANDEKGDLTVFYLRKLGKGISASYYETMQKYFSKDRAFKSYNEFQLEKYIGKGFSVFGRAEFGNKMKPKYLIGVSNDMKRF